MQMQKHKSKYQADFWHTYRERYPAPEKFILCFCVIVAMYEANVCAGIYT